MCVVDLQVVSSKVSVGQGCLLQVDKVLTPANPHDGRASVEPGKLGESFFFDGIHPSDFGHQAIADLLYELTWQGVTKVTEARDAAAEKEVQRKSAELVQGSAGAGTGELDMLSGRKGQQRGLLGQPEGSGMASDGKQEQQQQQQGEEEEEEDVPPPMVPGNPDVSASMCYIQVSLAACGSTTG